MAYNHHSIWIVQIYLPYLFCFEATRLDFDIGITKYDLYSKTFHAFWKFKILRICPCIVCYRFFQNRPLWYPKFSMAIHPSICVFSWFRGGNSILLSWISKTKLRFQCYISSLVHWAFSRSKMCWRWHDNHKDLVKIVDSICLDGCYNLDYIGA